MLFQTIQWVPELKDNIKPKEPLMIMVGTKVDCKDQNPNAPENVTDNEVCFFLLFVIYFKYF